MFRSFEVFSGMSCSRVYNIIMRRRKNISRRKKLHTENTFLNNYSSRIIIVYDNNMIYEGYGPRKNNDNSFKHRRQKVNDVLNQKTMDDNFIFAQKNHHKLLSTSDFFLSGTGVIWWEIVFTFRLRLSLSVTFTLN